MWYSKIRLISRQIIRIDEKQELLDLLKNMRKIEDVAENLSFLLDGTGVVSSDYMDYLDCGVESQRIVNIRWLQYLKNIYWISLMNKIKK